MVPSLGGLATLRTQRRTIMSKCCDTKVVETCVDIQLCSRGKGCTTIVFLKREGLTATLPEHPEKGEQFVIVAEGGNGLINGGKNPLECANADNSLFLELGTAKELLFSTAKRWIQTSETSHCLDSAFLTQNEWHINPVTGNDTNTGKTAATALKTYAQWQLRVGTWTILSPTGGKVTIFIDNDLPVDDPITLRNFLGQNLDFATEVSIIGKRKVLANGKVGAVTQVNRTTNTVFSFTNSNSVGTDWWAQWLGKAVLITSGAATGVRSYVAFNFSSKRAGFRAPWVLDASDPGEPGTFGPSPVNGNTFQIIDYTKATRGPIVFGTSSNGAAIVRISQLHFDNQTPGSDAMPRGVTSNCIAAFQDCISDSAMNAQFIGGSAFAAQLSLNNCCLRGGGGFATGFYNDFFNTWLPLPEDAGGPGYPGGPRIENDAVYRVQGDSIYVGDQANGVFCDMQVGGVLQAGPISFWNTLHGAFSAGLIGPGKLTFGSGDFVLGEDGYVPIWGKGNIDKLTFTAPQGSVLISQFVGGGGTPVLPTIEYDTGTGGTVAYLSNQKDADTAHAWDPDTASFTPKTPVTWANFLVGINSPSHVGAGFLVSVQTFGPFSLYYANATNPGVGSVIDFESFTGP